MSGSLYRQLANVRSKMAEVRASSLSPEEKATALSTLTTAEQDLETARRDYDLVGLPGVDPSLFSYGRLLKILDGSGERDKENGYELEVVQEMARRDVPSYVQKFSGDDTGAFLIPRELATSPEITVGNADVFEAAGATVVNVDGGAEVAFTTNDPRSVTLNSVAAAEATVPTTTHDTETGAGGAGDPDASADVVPSNFRQKVYQPRAMVAMVPMTYKIRHQAETALASYLTSSIRRGFGYEQSRLGMYGDTSAAVPADEPEGIINDGTINTSNWTGVDYTATSANTVAEQILSMWKHVADARGLTNAETVSMIGSNEMFEGLMKLKSSTGENLLKRELGPTGARFLVDGWIPMYSSAALRPPAAPAGLEDPLVLGYFPDYRIVRWGGILLQVSGDTETNFRKMRYTLRAVRFQDQGFQPGSESCIRSDNVTLP